MKQIVHSSYCTEHISYAKIATRGRTNKNTKDEMMFQKLVSNLAFSPALVGQLGFYAKRLKKEEVTRRVGLMFTVLALVVQSFAVFSPPEAANASSPSNFISGGVTSLSQYISNYDANTNNIKDLFGALGITRANLAAAHAGQINSKDGYYSWGLTSHFSAAQGEHPYTIKTSSGTTRTFYMRPLKLWDSGSTLKTGSYYNVYTGVSSKGMYFTLMKVCGNLVLKVVPPLPKCPTGLVGTYPNCVPPKKCTYPGLTNLLATDSKCSVIIVQSNPTPPTNPTLPKCPAGLIGTYPNCVPPKKCAYPGSTDLLATDSNCQPCAGDSNLWVNDVKCSANIVQSKLATNISQGGVDATTTTAQSNDKILYSISIVNSGLSSATVSFKEQLGDVLEYSSIIDTGGGGLDGTTLSWPSIVLGPGEKQTRLFTAQMLPTIPAMGQGVSDKTSYDCLITNTFGNSVNINVACPTPKQVEKVVSELPHTGASENIIFTGSVLAIITYFYTRSRQVKKEIRLIRRDFNAGTI